MRVTRLAVRVTSDRKRRFHNPPAADPNMLGSTDPYTLYKEGPPRSRESCRIFRCIKASWSEQGSSAPSSVTVFGSAWSVSRCHVNIEWHEKHGLEFDPLTYSSVQFFFLASSPKQCFGLLFVPTREPDAMTWGQRVRDPRSGWMSWECRWVVEEPWWLIARPLPAALKVPQTIRTQKR
jgi:hypothetical protein